MKSFDCSIRKAQNLLNAYNALHGSPKPVKGNDQGAVVIVPFALSGNARVVLNENVAKLMLITTPHDDAVKVLHKQMREKLDAEVEALKDSHPDEDERVSAEKKIDARYERELNIEIDELLERTKSIELEPIKRVTLNETANAFFPGAFALLLNEGLIEGASKKPDASAADKTAE